MTNAAARPAGATAIQQYDLIIVGGGIAGLAIAELLGRKAALRIKLIEREPQLASGASGRLEGWFHSGALYSGSDDAQTFLNCVNGIEDLVTLYAGYFGSRCNFVLQERRPGLFAPAAAFHRPGWFDETPVFFVLPSKDAPDLRQVRLKNDAVLWEVQRQRALQRLEAAFGQQHNWLQAGRCVAPSPDGVEAYDGACSLLEEPADLAAICARFDRSFGQEPSRYQIVRSADVAMNTTQILRDLTASALASGVEIETGVSIDEIRIDPFGPVRVNSLLCRGSDGARKHLRARQFVLALGGGFKSVIDRLNLRVRLRAFRSAMIVAAPAFSDSHFGRMSIKEKFHFNHLVQRYNGHGAYSMLANSAYQSEGADAAGADIDALLEAAERYFGVEAVRSRRLFSYECDKTEFISDEEEKRRYSYWIESPSGGNVVSVLPGKFSFFPTVAYQTYLRLQRELGFADKPGAAKYAPSTAHEAAATRLVAGHYPLQVLAPGA